MRLQTIAVKYPAHIRQFYNQHPELITKSYIEQYAAFISGSFGAPETRTHAFSEIGYQIDHIFANAEPMQKRWAMENGVTYNEEQWMCDIAQAQIIDFEPDILFMNEYSTFTKAFLDQIKIKCPSIRFILGWCGSPYNDPKIFQSYDIVLSNIPELVRQFKDNGHTSYHINHAFDPRILERIDTHLLQNVDFSFIGSISMSQDFHHQREILLLDLIESSNIEIWAYIKQPSYKKKVSTKARQLIYDLNKVAKSAGIPENLLNKTPLVNKVARWKMRPDLSMYIDHRISRQAHPPIFSLDMFQQLHDSKLTLNTHIDLSSRSASNMRLFEATGVGTCLLTDWKENLPELFEPEVDVVTYRSAEECIEKVNFLLEHENKRAAIAEAGQRRTLRDHTVKQRVDLINDIIQKHLRKAGGR